MIKILFFLFACFSLNAQNIASYLPKSNKFDSLIKSKRVVLLGEQTHGDGSHFKAKSDIIEYLHKEHGFNVLLFEQDFRQLYTDNDSFNKSNKIGYADTLWNSLFRVWQTQELKNLCNFVEQQRGKFKIGGLDIQIRYGSKFIENMLSFCSEHNLGNSNQDDINLLKNLFNDYHYQFTETQKNSLIEWLNRIIKKENSPNSYITQQAKSLIFFVDYCFYGMTKKWMKEDIAINLRDSGMVANAIWLIEQKYPNEKVIIWAHNSHILNKTLPPFEGKRKYLGQYLKERYNDQLLSVAFSSAKGYSKMYSYVEKPFEVSAKEKSFEYFLHQKGIKDGFLFLQELPISFWENNQIKYSYLTHFETYKAKWNEYADMLYFTNESYPANFIKQNDRK